MSLNDFRQFLEENAKDKKLLGHALESITVFANIVADKTYRLTPTAQADLQEIAGAIASITGQPIKKVILVSAASPDPALTKDRDGFNGRTLWSGIESTLWDQLHSKHKLSLWDGFERGGRKCRELGNELWLKLEAHVGRDLKAVFTRSVSSNIGYDLTEAGANHLWYGLFYFVGFCLNGNVDKIQKLAALISLLPKVIPLGEKRSEPGTWYALVA